MLQYHKESIDELSVILDRNEPLQCIDCGLMPYLDALELQTKLQEKVSSEQLPSVILLLEHPPVITLGIHKDHNLLHRGEQDLKEMGIDVVQIRRGGGTTAHNPGQLVIYPIIHLDEFGFHLAPFVHYLEHVGMKVLSETGIMAERKNRYPGLWVQDRKIASLGTQISKRTSMHGIAINLYNDLTIFDYIVPCGIDGVHMTSTMKEGGKTVAMRQLKDVVESSRISLLPQYGATLEATI